MAARRPFTLIAAMLFLLIAVAHIYRLVKGFPVVIGGSAIPMGVSWVGVVVAGLLGVMLLRESRH
ncbi:hypothetical protein [Sphingomonas sp.]|uniref:hypothetical protein n=1 Tax=Sphingomonas sp. TaxID=28214 RepID=UPI00286D6124|nr:hypothetical protein [Sphingomonas sp.]